MNAKLIFAAVAVLFCAGAFAEDVVYDNDYRAGVTGFVTGNKHKANWNDNDTVYSSQTTPQVRSSEIVTTRDEQPISVSVDRDYHGERTYRNESYEQKSDDRSDQHDVNQPLDKGTQPFIR